MAKPQNSPQQYASHRVFNYFIRSARLGEEAVLDVLRPSHNATDGENNETPSGYGQFRTSLCRLVLDVPRYAFVLAPCALRNWPVSRSKILLGWILT